MCPIYPVPALLVFTWYELDGGAHGGEHDVMLGVGRGAASQQSSITGMSDFDDAQSQQELNSVPGK